MNSTFFLGMLFSQLELWLSETAPPSYRPVKNSWKSCVCMLSQFPEMHQRGARDKLSVLLQQSHTTLYTRFWVRVRLRYFGHLEEVTFFLFCDHIGPNADASQPQCYFYKAKPSLRSVHMIVKWTSASVWFRKKPRFTSKVGQILFPVFQRIVFILLFG